MRGEGFYFKTFKEFCMSIHILDLIMYIFFLIVLWGLIDIVFDGEYTTEYGSIVGCAILLIFSIIYILLFAVYPDFNWVDIFTSIKLSPVKINW